LPRPLAEQAQAGRREGGEVAGADRAVQRRWRRKAAVDGVGEHQQQRGVHARAAGADLVEAHDEHGASEFGGEQRPGSRRMAADQPRPVSRVIGLAEIDDPVGADPGVAAVDGPVRGHLGVDAPGRPCGIDRRISDPHLRRVARDGGYLSARKRRSVDRDLVTHACGRPGGWRRCPEGVLIPAECGHPCRLAVTSAAG